MKKLLTMCTMIMLSIGILFGIANNTIQVEAKETTDYTIKVNLGTNCTTIYNKNGKAIKAMICSPSAETPTGTFYVPVKYRWHEMIGNCYAQYCTRIAPQILFHSVWYYRNGDKSSMSVGAYNVMGQKASHGCVRLLCKDAKWIYDHCAVGTKIVIFWGSKKDDPLKRPSFTPIGTGAFTSWDPTDPDPKNPYRKAEPKISAKSTKVEYGKKVKPADLVIIKDSAGNILTTKNAKIKIKGKINTKKLGRYKIKYTVKDSLGHKKVKTITFKVVDTKKPKITGVKSKSDVAMGLTVNLMSKAGAKAVSGRKLTSRLKVSVKYHGKTVKISKNTITFNKIGTYKITYKVTGINKKTATKTVIYKVKDHRVKIALKTNSVTINKGDEFNPYDYVDTLQTYKGTSMSIENNVKCVGDVDTSTPGTYIVTYTAQYKTQTYTKSVATLKVVVEEPQTPQEPDVPVEPEMPDVSAENKALLVNAYVI